MLLKIILQFLSFIARKIDGDKDIDEKKVYYEEFVR